MGSFICDDCAKKHEAKPKSRIVTKHVGECKYCNEREKFLTPVRDFFLKKGTPPYEFWCEPKVITKEIENDINDVIKAVHTETVTYGTGYTLIEEQD